MQNAKYRFPLCGHIEMIPEGNAIILHLSFCILHSKYQALMGTRGFARRLQRAAGWCKAAGRSENRITPELRTESKVGCAGSARYRAYECRFFTGTRVVPQRLTRLCLLFERQGRIFSRNDLIYPRSGYLHFAFIILHFAFTAILLWR